MKVKGSMLITLKSGQKALILLAENKSEQEKLYHRLSIDAYKFKHEIAEAAPEIEYISAGYKTDNNEIIWEDNYIPVPNWYREN